MEPLIFGLIVMAISAFFKNKKGEEDDEGQVKKTRSQPVVDKRGRQVSETRQSGQRTFKQVEDYAKEIYGELQTQMKENPEQTKKAMKRVEQAVDQTPLRDARKSLESRIPEGRLSAHQKQVAPVARQAARDSEDLFPLDSNDIQRGIILAEILMPPKSKRR